MMRVFNLSTFHAQSSIFWKLFRGDVEKTPFERLLDLDELLAFGIYLTKYDIANNQYFGI